MNFIEKQMAISERLFDAMKQDAKARIDIETHYWNLNANLMRKIEQRDEEIKQLRKQLNQQAA
jgi:hypothetical protein